MKMTRGLILAICYAASILTAGMLFGTGLIPAWGKWYSKDITLRSQVQSLQRGSTRLDSVPELLSPGMAWADGGVQQTAGLGVAVWRLPFETVANCLAQRMFPDRLAFGLFTGIVLFWILRTLTVPPCCRTAGEWIFSVVQHPECIACAFLLAFNPTLLALCRGRLTSCGEAHAYSYFFSVALFVSTVRFVRSPTLLLYCGLSAGSAIILFFVKGSVNDIVLFH